MEGLREELLEIVRGIRMQLIYHYRLGAFVYGLDTMEELLNEESRREKIERASVQATGVAAEGREKRYIERGLFEPAERDQGDLIKTKGGARRLSIEEKRSLMGELIKEIGSDCKRCRLGELVRSRVVFGEGNLNARIMFIGEGPGEEEDVQGLPFVGRAGQLLTRIIKAMGLERQDVYIANVVKCRPPENRTPLADEMDICGQFLKRQISIILPEVIIALGGTAASFLLGDYKIKIGQVRGRRLEYVDGDIAIPIVATFHPSYVLRRGESPDVKREVWNDIKIAIDIIGLEVKRQV
jgi:DNA polymerase